LHNPACGAHASIVTPVYTTATLVTPHETATLMAVELNANFHDLTSLVTST
jgi:hypothetical protein